MRAETETMQEDIRGFSLASLAEIMAEGRFLKAGFSEIHNGRICFTLTFAFIPSTTPATHFDPRRCTEKDGESGEAPVMILPSLIENGRLGLLMSESRRGLWREKSSKRVLFHASSGSDHRGDPNVHLSIKKEKKKNILPSKQMGLSSQNQTQLIKKQQQQNKLTV